MEQQTKSPANAVTTTKQPPPENPEAIRLRTKVVFSFWAVILLLGLPTWWKTTSIYRAELPLQDMLDWADGVHTTSNYPLHIWISAPAFSCPNAHRLVQETQRSLDDLNEYPILHQRLHLVDLSANITSDETRCGDDPNFLGLGEPALKILVEPTTESFSFDLDASPSTALARIPIKHPAGGVKALAQALQDLYLDEQIAAALQTVSLKNHNHNAAAFLKSQPYDTVVKVEKQLSRAYKSSPEFSLTFSLFTAGGAPSSWEIQASLRQHFDPLLQALSETVSFQVSSQVQLYSAYSPSVHSFSTQNTTYLKQHDLTAFVNAAEWPLAPSIGNGPTINFVLYIPSPGQIPLHIEGVDGTSWLIPQWGGVQIFNPVLTAHPETGRLVMPDHLSKDVLDQPFATFATQLLSLLGISQPDEPPRGLALRHRLVAYKRLSALNLYLRASSNLGSLSRLAQHLGQIPIPRNVAQLVDSAVHNLSECSKAFLESRWARALMSAKSSFLDSDKAFFDRSMVGQVYFPDEHKVAVYLPLLGPIGGPLIVGLVRELKRLASRRG
ncbi:hypothetical protein PV10_01982 [Exophiala mesophila]|uniref:GPI transamidase component PIG-S n=1 Tax=Exophiala mesophila TaxID=212818 RepID=A0A0D2A5A1_EXOME|nr:uncharacterized protein PV10_01982 [Exophiala mesophila]KIV94193.1 hypothetical protein PV10_01982 [Exophiala mesophila]